MIKKIKEYFKRRREAEDKAWKDFGDSCKYSSAFFAIAEMIDFHAEPFCNKCRHLENKQWNKETFHELLNVHNIKIIEVRHE